MKRRYKRILFGTQLAASTAILCSGLTSAQATLQPKEMRQIGEVDPRYVSYNVEAVEVTGGRFWKPYSSKPAAAAPPTQNAQNQPAGIDANVYQYRPPINLANPKMRKLASALAPAYLRVSGTWRNTTYFQDNDEPPLANPPQGYKGVMTRAEWKGVIDFGHAVGAELVTSVATSAGARDANGAWTPSEAKSFFDFTKSAGGKIVATEFMNEPTFAMLGGVPANYDAAAFAKDIQAFKAFLRKESPETVFLGPGSAGEGAPLIEGLPLPKIMKTEDMLKNTGPAFDAFSYHFYGTVSKRCVGPKMALSPEQTLAPTFFEKNVTVYDFYAKLRDAYLPGKLIWLTETGEGACGGDPSAATFVDSFRFLDQLGSLAQRSVKTVMLNTLAASDYGLLDEETLEPRPNFWAALLWKRLMGTKSLDPGYSSTDGLRVYAQCSLGQAGAVTLLILNPTNTDRSITLLTAGYRYTLTATDTSNKNVALNGTELRAAEDGTTPKFQGLPTRAGALHFPALTATFLELPKANNPACK